jgi:hypothetical protein
MHCGPRSVQSGIERRRPTRYRPPMKTIRGWLLALSLVLALPLGAEVTGKIVKVLPHHLDNAGKHTLSPSPFDRDAYQFLLRNDPKLVSGVRFDIRWKAKQAKSARLKLRLELLTTTSTKSKPLVFDLPVAAKSGLGRWTKIPVVGQDFERAGDIIAWRVTLWEGETQVAEQKSFLW